MKTKVTFLAMIVFCSLFCCAIDSFAQGTVFTYQGKLDSNGGPASGTYDLRFRLSGDALGTTLIGSPVLANGRVVTNGLFTVLLDFGAVFTGSNYWLQVDVKTNGAGAYTTLTPLQPLTPTPYAIMANSASNLLGSLPAVQLTGTVGTSQLANDSVTSAKILDGQVATVDLANGAVNSAKVLDGSLLGADLANNTVGSTQLADTIALGDSATLGLLNIYKVAGGGPAISLQGTATGGFQYLYQDDGQAGISLDGDSGGGGLIQIYAADGSVGVTLDGESGGAGLVNVLNTNGQTRVSMDGAGTGSGGQITVYAADGSSTVQIFGEDSTAGLIKVNNNISQNRVVIDGEGLGGGGQINLTTGGGGNGIILYGDSGGAGFQSMYTASGDLGIVLDADSGGGALQYLFSADGSLGVQLDGESTGNGGRVSVYDASGTETIQMIGAESSTSGGQILMRNASNGTTIQLDSDASGVSCGFLQLYKSDGTATITLNADTAGDGRITTQELQITGGSDLSEQFNINGGKEELQPGTVVCIDPEHPGELMASTKAYDRTVAGVISGAGGVKTGMMMGQIGTKADGKHPVALTGRVYVLADAAKGAIFPGDLLTTSTTPGHAMKVTNHRDANGSVLGKAMTKLTEGKGLVLVLVSLQ